MPENHVHAMLGIAHAISLGMNANEMVDASLARAEAALTSHDVAELQIAEQSLAGCLDWAAKQTGDEQLIRNVLRTVAQELRS